MTAITHGLLPAFSSDLGYDPLKDLVPIVLLTATPVGFFVNAKVPANSVAELADLIRANPGKLNYRDRGHRHRTSCHRGDFPVAGRITAIGRGSDPISR